MISGLTDMELSRLIAETLEPADSLPLPFYPHVSIPNGCTVEQGQWISPLKTRMLGIDRWEVRNMVHESQMTLMLLEKLIAMGGRGIAEAFMLAHGYKETP